MKGLLINVRVILGLNSILKICSSESNSPSVHEKYVNIFSFKSAINPPKPSGKAANISCFEAKKDQEELVTGLSYRSYTT